MRSWRNMPLMLWAAKCSWSYTDRDIRIVAASNKQQIERQSKLLSSSLTQVRLQRLTAVKSVCINNRVAWNCWSGFRTGNRPFLSRWLEPWTCRGQSSIGSDAASTPRPWLCLEWCFHTLAQNYNRCRWFKVILQFCSCLITSWLWGLDFFCAEYSSLCIDEFFLLSIFSWREVH